MLQRRNSQYMHDEKGHDGNYNYNLDQFVGMQETFNKKKNLEKV